MKRILHIPAFLTFLLYFISVNPIIASSSSTGNIYYVDSVSGSDNNNGLSQSAPWKTISKVNSSSFSSGDSVVLKRGGEWREQLTIPSSGTAGSYITFGAYGTGSKPIINAAKTVTGWMQYSGNIYTADISSLNLTGINQLLVDGDYYDMAHYPNSGYLTIDQDSTVNNYLIDSDISLIQNQVLGSELMLRIRHWQINNRIVSSYDSAAHRIEWNESNSGQPPRAGYGYYLRGKLWMLDAAKEWHYDSASRSIYIWLENGDNPSAHTVEVSVSSSGIYATGRSFIDINDILIKNAGINGIYLYDSSNIRVQNIEIYNSGQIGALLQKSNNITFQNNKINNSVDSGIRVRSASNSNIIDNVITNSGTVGQRLKNSYAGIHQYSGSNNVIKNNKIFYSGYAGISFFSGIDNIIQNNFIDNTCLTLTDCGAIYTWGVNSHDSQIIGNIVTNSIGGSNDGSAPSEATANGIYLDGGVSHMAVKDNTVINADLGIFMKGDFETINNNNVFKARTNAFKFQSAVGEFVQDSAYLIPNDDVVTNNNFFNSFDGRSPLDLSSSFGDDLGLSQYAIFDYNTYSHSYYESFATQFRAGYPLSRYFLPEWQSSKNQDLNSKDMGDYFEIKPYKVISTVGGNLVSNGNFDTNINGWTKWPSTAAILWNSSGGLDGGVMKFTSSDASLNSQAVLISNTFAIQSGKTYEVKFSVISDKWRGINVRIRRGSSPNDSLSSTNQLKIGTTRREIAFVFMSTTAVTNAQIAIGSLAADSLYYIDNISVKEVTATYNDASDDMAIYYNETTVSKVVDLAGKQYCDVNNNVISGSITLTPYTSKIVLSCFNNNDGVCNNRETSETAPNEGCSISSDTTAPAGTISINASAGYTNSTGVSLRLSATDTTGVTGYYLSTSSTTPSAGAAGWVALPSTASYSSTISYTLSIGDGAKTVYCWYEDAAGNISTSVSDAIILDTTAPAISITSPTTNATYSTNTSTLTFSGSASDAGSGLKTITYTLNSGAPVLAAGTTSWSMTGVSLISGSNTITVTGTDAANNASTDTITVTYSATASPAPVITSALSSTGTVAIALSYQITATNSPTSFNAVGLPAALSVSTGGLISGTPTTAGTSSVTISAANAIGTGSASLALSVYSACDLNRDGSTNVVDVQLQVNQALGTTACTSDLNRDGLCNVIDVQRDVNASLAGQCLLGP